MMKKIFKEFLELESAGGILLIISAIFALILNNTALEGLYNAFLMTPVTMGIGPLLLDKPLILWINDGLMSIFFLLIGLEVKRELLSGSLASLEKAIFPAIAAVGGMLAPALIYMAFNHGDPVTAQGWATPAATDIAFALGIMALLGNRVPVGLKIFLLALAIIDDLGVIIIIALFYSNEFSVFALVVAALAILVLFSLNLRGVNKISWYVFFGLILWVSVLKSGVHATLAGVIIGFSIPYNKDTEDSPLKKVEHSLHPYVAFFILPLFAFANAGVPLKEFSLSNLMTPLPMGIILGLFIGKPLGITIISYIAIKLKIARLPEGIEFKQIVAVSILCGIGFTMSMFIASLAFNSTNIEFAIYSRIGILLGSSIAAIAGYIALTRVLPKNNKQG